MLVNKGVTIGRFGLLISLKGKNSNELREQKNQVLSILIDYKWIITGKRTDNWCANNNSYF